MYAVFDKLLPEPHNHIVMWMLFELSTLHALAKVCLHTETTVCNLEALTECLGANMQLFKAKVCSPYETKDLAREAEACSCCTATNARKRLAITGKAVGSSKQKASTKAQL